MTEPYVNLALTGMATKNSLAVLIGFEAARDPRVKRVIPIIYPSATGRKQVVELIATYEFDGLTPEEAEVARAKFTDPVYLDVSEDHVPYPEGTSIKTTEDCGLVFQNRQPDPAFEAKKAKVDLLNANKMDNLVPQLEKILQGEKIHAVLHAIANMDRSGMGSLVDFMKTKFKIVEKAVAISADSYRRLLDALDPLLCEDGGSAIALTFHSKSPTPGYKWMRLVKMFLEESTKEIGIILGDKGWAINTVSAGVWPTRAAKSIPGYALLEKMFSKPPLRAKNMPRIFSRGVVNLLAEIPPTTGHVYPYDFGYSTIGFCVNKENDAEMAALEQAAAR